MILGIVLILAQGVIIFALVRQHVKRKKLASELTRANDRLRLAMETSKTVGWECDLASRTALLFGDLRTTFGISGDTYTLRLEDFNRYVHSDDRQRVLDAVADARRSHKPYVQEFRLVWPEGGITRWVACRGKFEYALNGKPARMFGLAVDTTERKMMEEGLKKSEEKFSKAFSQSPLALTLTSAVDHRYIEVNETFQRITGWSSREVVGRTPFDIGLWVDPSQRTEFVKRLMTEGHIQDLEVAFRTKDGHERTGLGAAELIEIEGERCVLSVIADITEIKQAREQSQYSERRFSQFFETVPEYCFITSPSGEILDANPAACMALEYTRDEIVGKPLSEIYVRESFSRIIDLLDKWKKTGKLRNEETVILTKNGQTRTVLLNAGQVLDVDGNLLFSTSVQTDISDFKRVKAQLREQEVRLDAMVESAMDAIIAIDEAQIIVAFNPAAEKMFRCSAKEAIGSPLDRFIPPLLGANHKSHMRDFDRTGITTRAMSAPTNLWAQRSDGEEFPIETSVSKTDAGGHELFNVIIRDVTEQNNTGVASAWQSAIVESSSDAIISMSLEGVVQSWNASAQRIYGYTKEEAIGQQITILIPSYLHYEQTELLRRIVAGERIDNFQTVRISKSGKICHVSITASPIRDLSGGIIGVSKIARDITASMQAGEALRESEERFRLVANSAPVMIWMSDPDMLCTYFNQPWLDFTGRTFEAEVGTGWTEGVHPDDLKGCIEIYMKAFDKREPYRMEYRLRHGNGEYRWVFAQGVPRFHADGSFAGYIGTCMDVTERKLAEEALATMSRRVIEAQEEERAWLARELHDDINQRIALLAASLAHLRQSLPPSALESSRQIDTLCNQAASLGIDVQTLSHRLHSSKLDYLGLKPAAAGLCREFSDKYGVEIDFRSDEIPKNLPKEISLCLFRVLQEALQNAMKHSGSKHFQVNFAMSREDIRLTVADGGHGFDPNAAAKGPGAGLTNMKERLKLVHGDLSIAFQPGDGTVVCARVPIGAEAKSAQATA